MFRRDPLSLIVRRVPRTIFGLVLAGTGISLMIIADLGLGSWDVLHQGISEHTGFQIGTISISLGFVLLLVFIPLRERLGVGTILNIVLIGQVMNILAPRFATPESLGWRIGLAAIGPVVFGIGSAFYISAGIGPGPRDGLMTGIAAHGYPIWLVRGAIELTTLTLGWLLGGTVGVGTVWFAFGIGPIMHVALPRLRIDPVEPVTAIGAE